MNSSIASASMAETYFLASKARHKLTKEASRPDLHLRQLVSHANLVDLLMDELAERRAKGKVNSLPQNNIVSCDDVTEALNNAPTTPSHIMEEDESDNEYEQVSTPNYTYQAYESIEEVDDDEDDEDEEVECDSQVSACFYNTTNTSVDDLQAPQLYYSSSSDEEDDLDHHSNSAAVVELHKSEPYQVSELPLASDSPIIVA